MAGAKVRNLRQSVRIGASPKQVYEALVKASEHAVFTGGPAHLVAKVGGRFDMYDGSLSGVVVDLEPNRRIVLAWRSSEWPEHHYSIADFALEAVKGGTRLQFAQFGIPEGDFRAISDGWKTFYWEPLKEYLES